MTDIDFTTPDAETLSAAQRAIRTRGFAVLRGAFDVALIDNWRQAFLQTYEGYLSEDRSADALGVGDLRKMVTVELTGVFAAPAFWGNPGILPLLEQLLGPRVTLDTAVCVTSMPGARAQRLHLDHPALFDSPMDAMIPPWSLGMFLPLVRADAATGTTEVEAGGHIGKPDAEMTKPDLDPGDVLLMDYRIRHRGGANTSDKIRPMMVLSYTRPWFIDSVNFGLQDRLSVPEGFIEALEDHHRPLFAKVKPEVAPMRKLAARRRGGG